MNNSLKFRKHESFYIRDGWIEKALNAIYSSPNVNIFAKNNGIKNLGIGSNMVKGLKYWLQAANLIETKGKDVVLTSFGKLIIKYDKYLENNFTWFLIHYNLCTNMEECPIFYGVFNINMKSFTKNEAIEMFINYFTESDFVFKKEYIEDDLSVFIKSYINENAADNPEDNYTCPLANLKLLSRKKDYFLKTKPIYNNLSYLIIYYALLKLYNGKSFIIEESMIEYNSPYLIFNLDKNMYLQYLEEMRRNGYITINKTAGLNTIYFEKKLSLDEIFVEYYGGVNYV